MKYLNTKTGKEITTYGKISAPEWELVKEDQEQEKLKPKAKRAVKEKR
ncbi:MAG: hypothetical protein LKE48_03245 [Solobacterium sp.]|jgi:hypothetical protein|nr:hypothetical protein [Solobacterium sp.]MCH4281520.1 hypothetical protein [Solobacterium sp.]